MPPPHRRSVTADDTAVERETARKNVPVGSITVDNAIVSSLQHCSHQLPAGHIRQKQQGSNRKCNRLLRATAGSVTVEIVTAKGETNCVTVQSETVKRVTVKSVTVIIVTVKNVTVKDVTVQSVNVKGVIVKTVIVKSVTIRSVAVKSITVETVKCIRREGGSQ